MTAASWLPELPRASNFAGEVDVLFITLLVLSAVLLVSVYLLITIFAMRYRANGKAYREAEDEHEMRAEVLWTVIPVVVFIAFFLWSGHLFLREKTIPDDALRIYVIPKQWMWKFEHENGIRELNELHLPVDTPVVLTMTSQDVIHSFYVPAFRVKQDVVPGVYERLWFEATRTGEFDLYCAEFCGTEHSKMRGHVTIMAPERYADWLAAGRPDRSLAEQGKALFLRHGCSGCHVSNTAVSAPALDTLYGTRVLLADGRHVLADENYLRDSMLLPDSDVVAGFPAIMPSYAGMLDESELLAIVVYLRTLGENE